MRRVSELGHAAASEQIAAGCTGKEPFETRGFAVKVQRRRNKSRDKDLHMGEPYKCRYCPAWHLGERHNFSALRRAFFKKRNEEQFGRGFP